MFYLGILINLVGSLNVDELPDKMTEQGAANIPGQYWIIVD